jgi:hypothetical protein
MASTAEIAKVTAEDDLIQHNSGSIARHRGAAPALHAPVYCHTGERPAAESDNRERVTADARAQLRAAAEPR